MTEVTLDPADTAATAVPSAPPGTSRAAGARIDAIGVGQHAGERQILHEVSLSIEPGELIALAGGSGAGKTTLLEILAGLRAPSAGQVRHDGVRIDARGTRGSGVGYVPQAICPFGGVARCAEIRAGAGGGVAGVCCRVVVSGRGGVRGWEAEGGLPVVKPAPSWMSSPSASQALGS